jgi:hypothetical protein
MLEEDQRPFVVLHGGRSKWVVYCTRALTRLTGFYPDDILGRELDVFAGPYTDRSVITGLWDALEQVHHGHMVVTLQRYRSINKRHLRPPTACLCISGNKVQRSLRRFTRTLSLLTPKM